MFWFLLLISAILLAKVEIQIEGKGGGARNLPVTWRATNKWVRRFFAMTSYHVYFGLFIIAIVHLPFAVGMKWNWQVELLIFGFIAFVTVFEDFLWFILNPAVDEETGKRLYGIRNFREDKIEWFKGNWGLICPIWYWWYLPVGIGLYIGATYI